MLSQKNIFLVAILLSVFGCATQSPMASPSPKYKVKTDPGSQVQVGKKSALDAAVAYNNKVAAVTPPPTKKPSAVIVEDITSESTTPKISAATIDTYAQTPVPDADANVVGAVLPLTGKNAGIGQSALNAIKLALDLDKPENKFRLAVFDSQGSPEIAAKGTTKLVYEDKAIALLGGFTSKEAASIAEQAEALKTPFIAFSQKSGLTTIGEHVFRNSLTPEMQVNKLVQYAFDKLSAKKFAILYPNDSYGVEFSNIFWDHVLARGGEVTAAQTYDPKETDFSEVVQKMIGTYYVEARAEEYKEKLREIKANKEAALKQAQKKEGRTSAKKSSRDSWSEEDILDPIVDFDVLFVPDNSRALGQIMAFMKYNRVEKLHYLGTNIWNSPDLPKRASHDKSSIYFVDALDVSTSADTPNPFFKSYLDLYGEEPTMLEIQAYESAKIIRDQLLSGVSSRNSLSDNLSSLGRSEGVTGELRMTAQRELERPIHILTLESGLIKKTE